MPPSEQLYLENRYLQLSPNYPHSQPKNWLHALVARLLDASDIEAISDPQHVSSTPLYQKFVQLCAGLHPRRAGMLDIATLFRQLYQIELGSNTQTAEAREKIMPHQHRLQYVFMLYPTPYTLDQYEVRSCFMFDNKLVILQSRLSRIEPAASYETSATCRRLDYLCELYHASPSIKARFADKRQMFSISADDAGERISSTQLASVINNTVSEIELLGYSVGANEMTLEYSHHRLPQYVVLALPKHQYLTEIQSAVLTSPAFRRLRRVEQRQLWLADDNHHLLSVYYNGKGGKENVCFRLFDERIPLANKEQQYLQHKLSMTVAFSPQSLDLDFVMLELGQMAPNNYFQEGIYLRFLELATQPIIYFNVIKRNTPTSLTYTFVKRSTLTTSVTLDETIQKQLHALLFQSRLLVVLERMTPSIKWEDYCFVNSISSLYTARAATDSHVADFFEQPYDPLTTPKGTASLADLDSAIADTAFCPVLSDRVLSVIEKNIVQCRLPEHYLTQTLLADEEVARTQCINAYIQERDTLMSTQQHAFMQLQSNRRNKIEHESLNGLMQINTKYRAAYAQILALTVLTARHHCESELLAEYQRFLMQFMLIDSEQLNRAGVDKERQQEMALLTNVKSSFFGALDHKRETVKQYVSQRRTMMDSARDNLAALHRAHQQRRALETLEGEIRTRMSSGLMQTLEHLWHFTSAPFKGRAYTQAQLFTWGCHTRQAVEQYVDMLKAPCPSHRNGQSILDTLFLAEDEGWDVFMGGSASRGSPWANDVDIKLSPAHPNVTDEQRLKLFLILQPLLDTAVDMRGYPEKGLMTFDIPGLKLPVNIVIYLTYKGQYCSEPLYNDDVVVRIKRASQTHCLVPQRAVEGEGLQFYRQQYDPNHPEDGVDKPIDLITVAHILKTQHIHPHRYDPPRILRVLKDIAYCPEKEDVNAEPLKALIAQMPEDVRRGRFYQETMYEFYHGKHKIAPAYVQAFVDLLHRYGLPACSHLSASRPGVDARCLSRPTYYGYAHLIELLIDRSKRHAPDPAQRLTVLACIEQVLERENKKALFAALCNFAAQANDSGYSEAAASRYTR